MKQHYIRFTTNWNNKLDCKSFTTLRPAPTKYEEGCTYQIYLKDKYLGDARVLEIREFKVDSINEFIAQIDTGYTAKECKIIMQRMYKGKVSRVALLLLRYTNRAKK